MQLVARDIARPYLSEGAANNSKYCFVSDMSILLSMQCHSPSFQGQMRRSRLYIVFHLG